MSIQPFSQLSGAPSEVKSEPSASVTQGGGGTRPAAIDKSVPAATAPAGSAPSKPESPLMDIKELAALLTCSTKHARRMADAGRCPPPIRLGTLVRWNRITVDDWIGAGCPVVRQQRLPRRK